MRAIARWCVQHRRMAFGAWLAGVIIVAFAAASAGSDYKNSFSLKGTQSFEALQLLQKAAPKSAGDIEQVVFAVKDGSITDPTARKRADEVLSRLGKLPTVVSIASPYAKGGGAQISASKKVAFADVTMTQEAQKYTTTQAKTFTDAVTNSSSATLTVAVGGQVAEGRRFEWRLERGAGRARGTDCDVRRVRVGARRAPAAGHRRIRARHRRLSGRPALAPDLDGVVQLAAGAADRPRRRGRLRAVHSHPPSPGPAGRKVGRGFDRRRPGHLRSGRAVRRHHRLHRAARHVRAGRQLPLRRGDRRGDRGRVHRPRVADPAAPRSSGSSDCGSSAGEPANACSPGNSRHIKAASGRAGRASSAGVRPRSPWPRWWRWP